MAEQYVVELNVEGDEVDWEVFAIPRSGVWESLDRGVAAVYGDALVDAGRVLRPLMPEVLQ
jgi:hypothetical protein